ncbi:MAG TPA: hypothetical protein VLE53_03280 [Gemmatimonadaceae bacterium]|nr:hypothetical protein [Gemmatimonadaceae bacterium]
MDLDLRHLLPLLIIGGSFAFSGTVLYGAWLLGRYRGREDRAPTELGDVELRLRRLEEGMENVAGALDRLEAAHHLTARLLTETRPSSGSSGRRVITPH